MIFKLTRENEKCYLTIGKMEILVSDEAKTLDECIKTLVRNFVLNDKTEKDFKKYDFIISKMERHNDFLSLFSDLYKRESPLFDCHIDETSYYSKPIYIYFHHRATDNKIFTTHLNVESFMRYGSFKLKDIVIAVVAEKLAKSLIKDKEAQEQIAEHLKNNDEWRKLFTVHKLETLF